MRTNESNESSNGNLVGYCLVLDERFRERTINDDDAMGA